MVNSARIPPAAMAAAAAPVNPPGLDQTGIANIVEVGVSEPSWVINMNNNITGLQSVLQQGNLSAGVAAAIEQAVLLTKHGVAMFAKVSSMESNISNRLDAMRQAEESMKSAIASKVNEIESKGMNLQNLVSDAVGGIGEAIQQKSNQAFMDMTGIKANSDQVSSRLAFVEDRVSQHVLGLESRAQQIENMLASMNGSQGSSAVPQVAAATVTGSAIESSSSEGNKWSKNAMEHKAVMILKIQVSDRQGCGMKTL